MKQAIECAKYIMSQRDSDFMNTFDGNMKLQKLLFFANMISLSENGELLYNDVIQAFENGCVIENVRLNYKNNFDNFKKESCNYLPSDFEQKDFDALNLTMKIFGSVTAKELSELTHQFDFWKKRYEDSKLPNGTYDSSKNIITREDMVSEIDKISVILNSFRESSNANYRTDTINGVIFSFEDDFNITSDIEKILYNFSKEAMDSSYSVYLDNESGLVIY